MSKGSQRRNEKFSNILNNWGDIDWSREDERRTGDEWCRVTGIIILDPDGWDRTNDSFLTEKIGFGEFLKRKTMSTTCLSDKALELYGLFNRDSKYIKCERCGVKYKWFDIDKMVWHEDKLVCKDWCSGDKNETQKV